MTLPLYKGNTIKVLPFFIWQIQNEKDMGRMTIEEAIYKAEKEHTQEMRRIEERKRDGIIRIACAILSGKSGLVNLDDVVEKATEVYNKIDAKL